MTSRENDLLEYPILKQKFGFINGVDNVNWPSYSGRTVANLHYQLRC